MATAVSLGEYATSRNVNKGTVHRCAQKLGIDTSQGLTQDAISRLEASYEMLRLKQDATAQRPGVTTSGRMVWKPKGEMANIPDESSIQNLDSRQTLEMAEFVIELMTSSLDREEAEVKRRQQECEQKRNTEAMLKRVHKQQSRRARRLELEKLKIELQTDLADSSISVLTEDYVTVSEAE